MREFLKQEIDRYAKLNHQQWGWVTGMILGLSLGTYVVNNDGLSGINWEIEGKIDSSNGFFKLIVEACVIPLTSGLFANLFSNMGAGIDVITNKNTLLSCVYKKCCVKQMEDESKQSRRRGYGSFFSATDEATMLPINELKNNNDNDSQQREGNAKRI